MESNHSTLYSNVKMSLSFFVIDKWFTRKGGLDFKIRKKTQLLNIILFADMFAKIGSFI